MTDLKNVVIGTLALALAYDTIVHYQNRKHFNLLKEKNKTLKEKVAYLNHRLTEAKVPKTKFDQLVNTYYNG